MYTTFYEQWDLGSRQQTFETIVLPGHCGFLEDKSEYKIKRLILWRTIHSYSFYWMNKRHLRTTWNWLVLRQRIVTKVRLASCCRPGISQKLSYFKVITNMTVTTAEGVQSGLAKNFFCQKTFDEIWERQKQNMWTEVLLKRLNPTASGSKI